MQRASRVDRVRRACYGGRRVRARRRPAPARFRGIGSRRGRDTRRGPGRLRAGRRGGGLVGLPEHRGQDAPRVGHPTAALVSTRTALATVTPHRRGRARPTSPPAGGAARRVAARRPRRARHVPLQLRVLRRADQDPGRDGRAPHLHGAALRPRGQRPPPRGAAAKGGRPRRGGDARRRRAARPRLRALGAPAERGRARARPLHRDRLRILQPLGEAGCRPGCLPGRS